MYTNYKDNFFRKGGHFKSSTGYKGKPIFDIIKATRKPACSSRGGYTTI